MPVAQNITVRAPGWKGVNKQLEEAHLDAGWATTMNNLLFDDAGRLKSRPGVGAFPGWGGHALSPEGYPFRNLTKVALTEITTRVEEIVYCSGEPGVSPIHVLRWNSATDQYDLVSTTTSFGSPDDNVKFLEFNGKVLGIGSAGGILARTTSAGQFTTVAYTGVENGGSYPADHQLFVDACSAHGRLFMLTETKLWWSALLNEADFDLAGGVAGFVELRYAWPDGGDTPVAVVEYNGNILVFGRRSFIIYGFGTVPSAIASGTGTTNVVDMATIYKIEAIPGIGLLGRECHAAVGYDLFLLSNEGLQTLSRVVQEKSMPGRSAAPHMRDYIRLLGRADTAPYPVNSHHREPRLDYLSSQGRLYASFYDVCIVFDLRRQIDDGIYPCTTITPNPQFGAERFRGVIEGLNYDVLTIVEGTSNSNPVSEVLEMSGPTDGVAPVKTEYEGAWLSYNNEDSPNLEYIKTLEFDVFGATGSVFYVKMWADKAAATSWTGQTTLDKLPTPRFNSGFFYGGGTRFNSESTSATHLQFDPMVEGETVRVGWTCDVFASPLQIHKMTLFTSIGKPRL